MYAENSEGEQPLCNEKIQKSVRYLLDNFTKEDVTTAEIAERSYVSEVYFRKLFKKDFGITPKQYLVNLRIKHAEKLIGTGYYSLQEVAFACGFNDYKYFTVEFKKHTGVSPSKYVYEPNR
jgi:AraC family L-rhamnose operon regulatory protein RhaS